MNDRFSVAERVYETLRDDIKLGVYKAGERIDISSAAMRLHTSISPVRAALNRLSGERLVESHPHEGFSVPHLSEVGLREQFEWSYRLALLALRWPTEAAGKPDDFKEILNVADTVLAIEALIIGIGELTPNLDLRKELAISNVRLHRVRRIEVGLFPDLNREIRRWQETWLKGDREGVAQAFDTQHDRRRSFVPQIIERLHQTPSRSTR